MKKGLWVLISILIIVIIAGIVLIFLPVNKAVAPTNGAGETTSTPEAQKASLDDLIVVDAPLINAAVSSPLAISGQARGNWYFEASFPVELKDASGNVLAQAPAQAQGDWMTTDFVPFALSLPFPAQTPGSHGTLVLHNDNPSGDPAKDKSVEIPVVF